MRKSTYPIYELLPHGPPMVLLDDVQEWDHGYIAATLSIRADLPFFEESGVPSYVGLEYMAQTCGAYAGLEALELGMPVRLGFLLGTRNYHATVDWFRPGEKLVIIAKEILRQELMGVFDCRILSNGTEIVSAQLNLYQPEDAVGLIESS